MTLRQPLMIGFGGQRLQEADHYRLQKLVEKQCERTGQSQAEAEAALYKMNPSELALLELTGSPSTPGKFESVYDPGNSGW